MQIARVFGTPIRIDASWLFIFALLAWTLSSAQGPLVHVPPHWRLAVSIGTAIALFVCVLAHELAHVAVAHSFGIRTREIVLFAFGGVSRMETVGATPAAEAQISAAGPAMSVCIGVVCTASAALFAANSTEYDVLSYLALINIALAIFNCVPAYPVDGGRLLHALAWRIAGDRTRATQISVKLSTGVGVLMSAGGMALLFTGNIVDGVWITLLAWFIMRSAQAEYVADVYIQPLAQVRCADLVDPPADALQPDLTCAQGLTLMMASHKRAVPVAVGHRLLGMLSLEDFAKIGELDPSYVYVSAIMTPAAQLQRLAPDISGLEALKQLSSSVHPQLPVVDENGNLLGFVTRETLIAKAGPP